MIGKAIVLIGSCALLYGIGSFLFACSPVLLGFFVLLCLIRA